jgi:hypothetical protein
MPAFALAATREGFLYMRKLLNRRTIGSGSVLALLVGLSVSALPSTPVAAKPAAKQPSGFTISILPQRVTSSSGTKLIVQMSGNKFKSGSSTSSSANFFISAKGARDSHSWNFPLSNSSVTYNTGTGKGALKTGQQAKPYGLIKLNINDKGKPNVTKCHTYKAVSQPVVLRGKWGFNTRSHGKHKWGKTARHGKLKGTVSYSFGTFQQCGGIHFPCFKGERWNVFHPFGSSFNNVSFSGSVTGNTIFASRTVSLAKPNNASRNDNVSVNDPRSKSGLPGR